MNPIYKTGAKFTCEDPFKTLANAPNLILHGHAPNGRPVQVISTEGESITDIRFLENQPRRDGTAMWELEVVGEFEKGSDPRTAQTGRSRAAGA